MADPLKPIGPPTEGQKPAPLVRRLLWFAGLALAGLVIMAAASYLLRTLLFLP